MTRVRSMAAHFRRNLARLWGDARLYWGNGFVTLAAVIHHSTLHLKPSLLCLGAPEFMVFTPYSWCLYCDGDARGGMLLAPAYHRYCTGLTRDAATAELHVGSWICSRCAVVPPTRPNRSFRTSKFHKQTNVAHPKVGCRWSFH